MRDAMDSLLQALQNQPLPAAAAAATLVLVLLGLALLSRRRRLPYPPGPRGLPIIGNMLMLDQMTHRGLASLARKYGGLLHLRMGFLHMVAVSSPEHARQILQLQDHTFSNRPATIAISYLTYDRADMAFAHYGPFWRQMRKICVMRVFSRKRAESWRSVRDEVDKTVRAVAGSIGTVVNIGELVFALTRDITYRAAFGASATEGQDEFIGILQEFSKLFGAFNLADFIPYLGRIDPQGINERLVKARGSLDRFIDKIMDDHMEKKNKDKTLLSEEAETDMVDDLLAFYGEEEAKVNESEDLQNSIKLTRENIKAIIMDVMFGGTETVASAIEWAMAELMRSPEDLKKVQKELADVVGLHRRVEESDFEKLTYLKCVIKETLRLHPPIPLLLHETAEDAEVSGYFIPAKTRVMINAWAIGRDPTSWEDPDTFKPSRFLNEGAPDFKGSNFEFIPFGSGRRSCPGMQLGLYGLEFSVANLIHSFTWELPDGQKPGEMDMSDVFGLTAPRAERLMAIPSPRLLCPLY
ncbi:cytochrome P450 84A1 [Eucalyptus grandis]|uniref:cytochrome P450 84A1 n=1 Tax=Eucalyptus grandis TaxID=71139 RepID=UPI000195ACF0|nr:cytochrome P450 84A1 [Eucalyptus grandis]